jgi:hypothetical protein
MDSWGYKVAGFGLDGRNSTPCKDRNILFATKPRLPLGTIINPYIQRISGVFRHS